MRDGVLRLAETSGSLRFTWSWPNVDVAGLDPTKVVVSREPDERQLDYKCQRYCRRLVVISADTPRPRRAGVRVPAGGAEPFHQDVAMPVVRRPV
jgi:hypothetical protein